MLTDLLIFQSRHEQQVTKLVVTQDDSLLFAADHVGYICVYDIKEFAISNEQKSLKSNDLFFLLRNPMILNCDSKDFI